MNLIVFSQFKKIIVPDFKQDTAFCFGVSKTNAIYKLNVQNHLLKKNYEIAKNEIKNYKAIIIAKDSAAVKSDSIILNLEQLDINNKEIIGKKDNNLDLKDSQIKGLKKSRNGIVIGGVVVVTGITLVAILTNVKL